MLDRRAGRERVERAFVPEAGELRSGHHLREGLVGEPRDHHPLAVLAPAVALLRVHGGGDVGRERPRRRRPDHE